MCGNERHRLASKPDAVAADGTASNESSPASVLSRRPLRKVAPTPKLTKRASELRAELDFAIEVELDELQLDRFPDLEVISTLDSNISGSYRTRRINGEASEPRIGSHIESYFPLFVRLPSILLV